MNADCYPIAALPNVSPLFRDYAAALAEKTNEKLQPFYSPYGQANEWMRHSPDMDSTQRERIVALLKEQNRNFGASAATLVNLEKLGAGAGAVVTGQQAGLFGGPLLTLLKAATAIRLAGDASRAGHPHVPIFWVASEDHDFDEVNQAAFFSGPDVTANLRTLRLPQNLEPGKPVGAIRFGDDILPLIDELRRCIGDNAICDLLASLYTPTATFSSAFATFLARIFEQHGLIVIDAASRPFHALAGKTLQAALESADEILTSLLERTRHLEQAGYHAQVAVTDHASLFFLIDETTGVRTALKKLTGELWSAGPTQYSTADLLAILRETPERISPNVLLRPVVQDTLLPTSVYIGGPSEIAYFAQSQVVYERVLGRTTPILPRFSATLIEPQMAKLLDQHQLSLTEVFTTRDSLAQRLGARAMPIEGKQKLAVAGKALDSELKPLLEWMHSMDQGLGHAGDVAASKMLYQMNRLRRLAAEFSLQRDQSLRRHADALTNDLFPEGNLQERVVAGSWFLARFDLALVDLLVEHATAGTCGHQALYLTAD